MTKVRANKALIANELAETLDEMIKENIAKRKGRKMRKELRPGKIVYYVHGLGRNSSITKYKITRKPYDGNRLGSDFYHKDFDFVDALYFSQEKQEFTEYESKFSLGDCNVIPNTYNNHRLFLTPQAAVRYLEWAKVNTNAPQRDFDGDWGWSGI